MADHKDQALVELKALLELFVSDVRRSVHMFRKVGIPVLGVTENMSYLLSDCGAKTPIFGRGGGQQLTEELHTPLLGQMPIGSQICASGDLGTPIVLTHPDSKSRQVFRQIAAGLHTTFDANQPHVF